MRGCWPTACFAVIASCAGTRSSRIDPARFAARPEWTPATYALPAGSLSAVDPDAAITRDEAIADVAYLDHVLASAWPEAGDDLGRVVRERARDAPLTARTGAALCDELARQTLPTSIRFRIGGRPCPAGLATIDAPLDPLLEVPSGRNYGFRIDGEVAVLAIARFADPADAGWDGFGDVLRDLATRDLVALDLQRTRGDDPRMGFAVLAALGREGVDHLGWRAPAASDGPYAQVARANLAAHAPAEREPRSRALWATFGEPGDPAAIAHALSPVTRDPTRRLAMLSVVIGRDCEAACRLVAVIAHLASGAPPALRVELVGAAPGVAGDERGLVRLPRSGVEVTFPTATYGPTIASGELGNRAMPGFATQIVPALQLVADQRAEARAWNARPVPACGALAPDLHALAQKLGGCAPTDLRLGKATPGPHTVTLELALDQAYARKFLAGCPDLTVGSSVHDELHGLTIASVTVPVTTMERLAAATFVHRLEWPCQAELK
jgi:hypothetical protein